jgi:putative glutathione S-transferase
MSTPETVVTPAAGQDARFVPPDLLRWQLGGGRVLRLARPDEFDEVGRVLQAAFSAGCWVTPTYRDHLARIAERAAVAHVWVVADADGILGAVLTPRPELHRDDLFTFNILGVGPRGRGLDLGWQLTDHSVALARAYGYPGLEIRSSPQMTAAHALYHRYGFVRRTEWETAVVDSGQRLFAFTYRVPDPQPRPAIPPEEPPTVRILPDHPLEATVSLENHLPPGRHDAVGDFRATPPTRPGPVVLHPGSGYRLFTSLDALRGRAALLARRLAGVEDQILLREDMDAASPTLYDSAGDLVSDDWRYLARSILATTAAGRALYPSGLRAEIDTLDEFIHTDLVEGIERAIFAGSDAAGRIAQRVLYARLGELDQRLSTRRYLLGENLTEADLSLFAVLIGFDLEYRGQLGWGAASLVDYPNLWAYARGLLQLPRVADDAELVALGLLPGPDGHYAGSWGEPPAVEGLPDLRSAWLEEDDRELGAA